MGHFEASELDSKLLGAAFLILNQTLRSDVDKS